MYLAPNIIFHFVLFLKIKMCFKAVDTRKSFAAKHTHIGSDFTQKSRETSFVLYFQKANDMKMILTVDRSRNVERYFLCH